MTALLVGACGAEPGPHVRQKVRRIAERLPQRAGASWRINSRNDRFAVAGVLDEGAGYASLPGGSSLTFAGAIHDRATLEFALGGTVQDDVELVARAWVRWGLAALDRLIGDYALVVITPVREVFLARGFLGTVPLFFAERAGGLAWASTAQALRTEETRPDFEYLARFVGGVATSADGATAFRDIWSVPHGRAIRWRAGQGRRTVWRWHPPRGGSGPRMAVAEAGAELRRLFDASVRDRVGDAPRVATQLSGGRDSAAVLASLAGVAPDRPLIAVTAAPSATFDGAGLSGRLWDESALAKETAACFPGTLHQVVRPREPFDLGEWTRLHAQLHRPLPKPALAPWTAATHRAAADFGVPVLFKGGRGNFTISLGTHFFLADLVARDGLGSALAAAARASGASPRRWRSALHALIGPHLPLPVYRLLAERSGVWTPSILSASLLRQPWRHAAEKAAAEEFADPRPALSEFELMAGQLESMDTTSLALELAYGVQSRDPCADRRLVEFIYGLPPAVLVPTRTSERPLFEAAFGRELPDAVTNGRRRGLQAADWHLQFPLAAVRERWLALLQVPVVSELFDAEAVVAELAAWPKAGDHHIATQARFRDRLLGALAVADWLALHFG